MACSTIAASTTPSTTTTVSNKFFRQLWYLAAFSWLLYSAVAHYLSLFIKKYFHTRSRNNDPVNFVNCLKTLPKVPSHVALAFQYDRDSGLFRGYVEDDKYVLEKPTLNLEQVARVTGWIAGAGIPVISLYDYHGTLKLHYSQLKEQVEHACRLFAAQSATEKEEKIVDIVWHKVLAGNECDAADVSNSNAQSVLLPGQVRQQVHIFLYSYVDGKPRLVEMVKQMYIEKFQNNVSAAEDNKENICVTSATGKNAKLLIDVNTVNEYLGRKCCSFLKAISYKMEPDLLISFGSIKSTLDFLPWHIRLTELHWLPQVKHVQLYEVLRSFYKYASCEQRFGK